MSRTSTFGIVGGYGATGSAVAAALLKSCHGEILIGGRDLSKGLACAAKFGPRASAVRLDVFDGPPLMISVAVVRLLSIAPEPVMLLRDRVAQAAFRSRCHYVDVAGLTFVKEGMLSHAREATDLGLSFVVSAGWMPGISELVPT